MNAANNTSEIDKNFMSTDDPKLAELARTMGFDVIERPEHLVPFVLERMPINMVLKKLAKTCSFQTC